MIRKTRQIGVELSPENIQGGGGTDLTREGELSTDSSDSELKVRLDGATRTVVTEDQAQTLTNKTIDADLNTISDLEVDNLKAGVLNVSTTLSGASDTQVPSALAVKTYVDNGLALQNQASEISVTPAGTIVATNVQAAIEELDGDIQGHINDTVDAHDASAISNIPSGNLAATDIQGAVNELQGDIDTNATAISNHISDSVDAHDASAISNSPSGNLVATDVQSALNEIQTDVDTRATTIALTTHINDTANPHVVTKTQVGLGNVDNTSDVNKPVSTAQQTALDLKVNTTGGSVITPARLDMKQDTLANLTTYALTATNGQLVFATDTKDTYVVKDGALSPVGGGGGGLSEWITATSYVIGNIVYNGTGIYKCIVDHISGTFLTDLASSKWIEMSTTAIEAFDNNFKIKDSSDPTKELNFNVDGTTGTLTTIFSNQTANRLITLPDASTTLVGTLGIQTISDKTFVAPVLGAATGTSLNLTGGFSSSLITALNMLPNGDVEVNDISMFTVGSGNAKARTTTAGEVTSNTAALKITVTGAILDVSQSVNTPSGIQKQGFLRIAYKIPAAITDAQICTMVDGAEQTCVPSSKLINNGLYQSIEVPLTFGSTSVGWKAKTTATNFQEFFFDNMFIGQGLGLQNLQKDSFYSAKIDGACNVTNQNQNFLNSPGVLTNTSTCTFTFITGFGLSTPMTCTSMSAPLADVAGNSVFLMANSTSGISTRVTNDGVAATPNPFHLICQKSGNDYLASSANVYSQASGNYDWTNTTVNVLTNLGTSPSPATVGQCKHSRVGGDLLMDCSFTSGTSVPAALGSIDLPNSLTIDAARIIAQNTTAAGGQKVGTIVQSAAGNIGHVVTALGTSTSKVYLSSGVTASNTLVPTNSNGFISASTLVSVSFRVPISGWTNSSAIVGSFENVPTVPGAGARIDTFSVSFGTTNATTACSASPCSYLDQIGTAVSSVTRSGTGQYALVTSKTYAKLKCSGGGLNATTYSSASFSVTTNTNTFPFAMGSATNAVDAFGTLTCQGLY